MQFLDLCQGKNGITSFCQHFLKLVARVYVRMGSYTSHNIITDIEGKNNSQNVILTLRNRPQEAI